MAIEVQSSADADLRERRMQGLRDAGLVVARPVQWRLHD